MRRINISVPDAEYKILEVILEKTKFGSITSIALSAFLQGLPNLTKILDIQLEESCSEVIIPKPLEKSEKQIKREALKAERDALFLKHESLTESEHERFRELCKELKHR